LMLDNLECGTLAMNYYNKLWQMTLSTFPHLVDLYTHGRHGQDRYQELMRVSWQWRHLKNMKWHGFGHHSNQREPGDLALFSPACPQRGINLLLTTEESLNE
ncbi:uncharacterized protein EDB91DRAFT_1064940, partial [Suillus paluster]|uniref:uncharacterized protein n=1 Tax=Suillus paluster TaxID=48578 RepID=UPI001B85F530